MDSQTLGENTDIEKKRFSSSGEEDKQSKKPKLISEFSGEGSGRNGEEKVDVIKTNKVWRISGIVQEDWDDDDQSERRKDHIDLERATEQHKLKNILKRNFSDES